LLVVAQFYFLMHLRWMNRALSGRESALLAPWIGVYIDLIAQSATVASGILLPVTTVVFLAFLPDAPLPLLVPVALASVVLALATVGSFRLIWDRLRQ
jgi:hypothetical protein